MKRIPVHVVAGFLGAGKTTLLIDQLRRREERCAVIVNDFGEARIDATLLGGRVAVTEIAGGCVCCTAPESLVPSLIAALDELGPERVFIEATGLARPADIVDTLRRGGVAERVEVAPVVVVVDPQRLGEDPPPLLLEQLDAADVVVANRAEERSEEALERLRREVSDRFPPLLALFTAQRGVVPLEAFELRRAEAEGADERDHDHTHTHAKPSTVGWSAASRLWTPERVFSIDGLVAALQRDGIERVKGLFRTDLGWFRLDRASGSVERSPTSMRSASAVDVIVRGDQASADAVIEALDEAVAEELGFGDEPTVLLRGADGFEVELTRYALAALPGQVADVSTRLPKRQGSAVALTEVLALAGPSLGERFILVAADGMTSAPAPVEEVGGALLLHSLDDGPLPERLGGPYRVLVPPAEAESACANVKGVIRVVIEEQDDV